MNYNKTNPFTLGQVLSVTHGTLMCDIGGVYVILGHMTGQQLFTHQLIAAREACAPVLKERFPAIAAIDLSEVNTSNWRPVLTRLVAEHGDAFECPELTDWEYSDPIQSAVDMLGADKVIVVSDARDEGVDGAR